MKIIRPKEDRTFDYIPGDSGVIYLALGNVTMFQIGFIRYDHGFFIGVVGRAAYIFSCYAHWVYVAEKLNLYEADARNLADFINTQTNCITKDSIQGFYDLNCCQKIPRNFNKIVLS